MNGSTAEGVFHETNPRKQWLRRLLDAAIWGPPTTEEEEGAGQGKGRGEITEEDVRKLTQVADAFPKDRVHAYIVFSKTVSFTAEEIARCRTAQPVGRRRVILLSDRELEPYFVYEARCLHSSSGKRTGPVHW